MFVLLVQCDGKETRIGDIALSLPCPSTLREHHLNLPMDQWFIKGRAIYCQTDNGTGTLIPLYSHVKYNSGGSGVSIYQCMHRSVVT